jgi:thiol-disulfide isomerase/thioredoxin
MQGGGGGGGAGWLSSGFDPPLRTEAADDAGILKPAPKPPQQPHAAGRLAGVRTDAELAAFLAAGRGGSGSGSGSTHTSTSSGTTTTTANGIAVVEFATSWCAKCREMLPAFLELTRKVLSHRKALLVLVCGGIARMCCCCWCELRPRLT